MRAAIEASIRGRARDGADVRISGTRRSGSGTIAIVPPRKGSAGGTGHSPSQLPKAKGRTVTDLAAAPLSVAARQFFDLTNKLRGKETARSENDLSRKLAAVLEEKPEIALVTVVDTNPRGSRKRPDILGYRAPLDADLVLAADIVIESKLPQELATGTTIVDAVTGQFWVEKARPYITHNASRLQYFILTTFTDYACVRITDKLRRALLASHTDETELRALVHAETTRLTLDGSED